MLLPLTLYLVTIANLWQKIAKENKIKILPFIIVNFDKNVYTWGGIIPPVMTIELISGSIIEHE